MGTDAVIIYFALCLSICIMVFMTIISIMIFIWVVFFQTIIVMKKGIFRFVSMIFYIFEKGMRKKTLLGIFRFVSMLF